VGKLLLLLVIGLLVGIWIAKSYRRREHARETSAPRQDEDMVRCAQCGVHLPRSESVALHGRYYCSAEHQRQHSAPD
jgi:uncharacterized protein